MATLTVYDTIHYNDVGFVTLEVNWHDILIPENFLLHYADVVGVLHNLNDASSDHVADHLTLTQRAFLNISESYHAFIGDIVSFNHHIWTSDVSPPLLPIPILTANGDTHIWGKTGGSRLPGLTVEMRSGLRCGSGKLSDLGISASGSSDTLMSLSKRLPTMSLSARAGARCGTMKLPVPELDIVVIGDLVGRLSKTLPGLSISATGKSDFLATLSKRLPMLTLTMGMTGTVSGSLSKNLPTLKLTGAMSLEEYGNLAEDIPSLIVSSMTGHQSSIEVSVDLPTIIMSGIGTGGVDSGGGYVYDEDRFDDYVLRYAR